MKYNQKRTKILIRFKKNDPDTDEEIECFRYMPYPNKPMNVLTKKIKNLAKTYGYNDYHQFWNEVIELASLDGFLTPWEFVNKGRLDDYFFRTYETGKIKKK